MMDIGLVSDDLDMQQGDFTNVESTYEHQRQLLINGKGTFKQNPTVCVGLLEYLDDEDYNGAMTEILAQFNNDGMTVKSINTTNQNIDIDAYYP